MPDSAEVISVKLEALERSLNQHTLDCAENRKETKQELAILHKRITEVLSHLTALSLLDQKVNTCSAHVEVLEQETKDLDAIRAASQDGKYAIRIVVVTIVTSVIAAAVNGMFN